MRPFLHYLFHGTLNVRKLSRDRLISGQVTPQAYGAIASPQAHVPAATSGTVSVFSARFFTRQNLNILCLKSSCASYQNRLPDVKKPCVSRSYLMISQPFTPSDIYRSIDGAPHRCGKIVFSHFLSPPLTGALHGIL